MATASQQLAAMKQFGQQKQNSGSHVPNYLEAEVLS
jgi:hypothetical protein